MDTTTTDEPAPVAAEPDGGEFAAFYRREHEGQVRRAFLLTGDAPTAHDVVADAFVAVLRRWRTIEQPGPYLSRCVLNGCRDVRRIRPREQARPDPEAEDHATDPVDDLADVLAGLPFRQRAAVVLRFYGGLSQAEIADQLGCRPGTVGSLIHRALKRLRTTLELEEGR